MNDPVKASSRSDEAKNLISVVVIGYNIEKFVNECLDSVLAQDYENFEVIFVNDGSTDNTKALAEKYLSDPRFKLINKENGGCVSARKAGVKIAKGEYIMFVDGDDWINTDMLSNLAKFIGDDKPDIIKSNFYSQKRDKRFKEEGGMKDLTACENDEYFKLIMSHKIAWNLIATLYKREFILNAGFLNYPETGMGEDLMASCFFGLHNPKVKFAGSCDYYYRFNSSSATKKGGKVLLEESKTLRHMEDYVKKINLYEKYKSIVDYQWIVAFLRHMCANIPVSRKIENMHNMRPHMKNFMRNEYSRECYKNLSLRKRFIFNVYYHAPYLMYVLEPFLNPPIVVKNAIESIMRVFSGQN